MRGICECGCGGQTRIAKLTDHRYGHVRGKPVRFIFNHHLPEVARRQRKRAKVTPDLYTVDEETGCWNWNGAMLATTGRNQYGRLHQGKHKRVLAHRWAYERLRGPIPEGLVIDHLCRNTKCVNPDHLELVTIAENNRRGLLGVLRKGA